MPQIAFMLDVNEVTYVEQMTSEEFVAWWQTIKDEVLACKTPYVAIVFSDKGFMVRPVKNVNELAGAADLFRKDEA